QYMLAAFCLHHFSADFIICTCEFDFRQAQVAKLDRLARSSRHLDNNLHDLGEIDCGLLSLGESWCDTTSNVGRLLIAIMSGVAEFERGIIRERCEEGIARARRKGTKFGRKSRLDAGQRSK